MIVFSANIKNSGPNINIEIAATSKTCAKSSGMPRLVIEFKKEGYLIIFGNTVEAKVNPRRNLPTNVKKTLRRKHIANSLAQIKLPAIFN